MGTQTRAAKRSPSSASARAAGLLLALYWLALFAATHLRIPQPTSTFPEADKLFHFAGYAVLGFLLTLRLAMRRRLSPRGLLVVFLILAVYGVVDELLQIPVGRTCDVWDWVFDVTGGAVGMAAVVAVERLRLRFARPGMTAGREGR